jgi:hypothetical protein
MKLCHVGNRYGPVNTCGVHVVNAAFCKTGGSNGLLYS